MSPSLTRIFWIMLSGAAGIAVAIGILAGRTWFGGVTVIVKNDSGGPLRDITIWYTGGQRSRRELTHGSEFRTRVQANSESHVEVTYRVDRGDLVRHEVDCYFEAGYRGEVVIGIHPGGNATSRAKIELPWPVGAFPMLK